ncbi:MAG: hypothetical protein ACREA1_01285 [Nitrosotalea sp.]
MPDKLCRTCGGDLIKWSTCAECRKVVQKICTTCNVKTIEEFHFHHIHLEPYQIVNTKSTVATVQSYQDPPSPKISKKKKNHRNNMLVISGIVAAIIILGVVSSSHPEYSIPSPSKIKEITPSESPSVIENTNQALHADAPHVVVDNSVDTKYTYDNCLGVSDGTYLTVTCPTTYGNVYKAVVQIPTELVSQFENNIFNLRGISVIEHMDSISIQYAKKMYEAKFVNS